MIIVGAGIGGVPTAAVSGRNVIQILCKRDHKSFVARTPGEN